VFQFLLEDLSKDKGKVTDQLDAMLSVAVGIGVVFFYGVPITPLHACNLPAGVAAECFGEFVKFFDEPVANTPHSGVFFSFEAAPTVQGRNCGHCAKKCPADCSGTGNSTTKSPNGSDNVFIFLFNFFQTHGQDGLASMETFFEKIHRLFSHIFWSHGIFPVHC